MKTIARALLLSVFFLFSSLINFSFADDDVVKFKLEIKPNQQKVEAKIDGNEHKQIQIRAEYIKFNNVTNNHQIKITLINNSGQPLLHQLALINKIEGGDARYTDGTTDYIKNDDGKQIVKTLSYYNYGNIKPTQTTIREWYISNTGKDEIEVNGYLISKEIPIVVDPGITQADPNLAAAYTAYLMALRDNDLQALLATVPNPFERNLVKQYTDAYNLNPGLFPQMVPYISHPYKVAVVGGICYIHYTWVSANDGKSHNSGLELQKGKNNKWWITL